MRTEDLINLLSHDLQMPVRNAGAMLRRWLPLAALAAGGGFLAIMGVRDDFAADGFGPTVMKLALGGILAIGAAIGAIQLTRPETEAVAASRWLAAAILLVAVIIGADFVSHGADSWPARLFGKSVLSCLTLIPTIAAVPLIAALMAMRHGATTAPRSAGALAGVRVGRPRHRCVWPVLHRGQPALRRDLVHARRMSGGICRGCGGPQGAALVSAGGQTSREQGGMP